MARDRFFTPTTEDLATLRALSRADVRLNDRARSWAKGAFPIPIDDQQFGAVLGDVIADEFVSRIFLDGEFHILLDELGQRKSELDPDVAAIVDRWEKASLRSTLATPFNGPIDLQPWLERTRRFSSMVCAIEVPGAGQLGTGFLIGPDLVLTSNHVFDRVLSRVVSADRVRLVFDRELLSSGSVSKPTDIGELADDWHVTRDIQEALQNDLDFIVVRTRTQPGNTILPGGYKRSWVDLPRKRLPVPYGLHVAVFHRPQLHALYYSPGVVCKDADEDRVLYSAKTQVGSSGSPVFTIKWDLVAVHNRLDDRPGSPPVEIEPKCAEGVLSFRIGEVLSAKLGKWPDPSPFRLAID